MYKVAKLPSVEREILFQNTAAKMGMNAAIIEKDFWVCLTYVEMVTAKAEDLCSINVCLNL